MEALGWVLGVRVSRTDGEREALPAGGRVPPAVPPASLHGPLEAQRELKVPYEEGPSGCRRRTGPGAQVDSGPGSFPMRHGLGVSGGHGSLESRCIQVNLQKKSQLEFLVGWS